MPSPESKPWPERSAYRARNAAAFVAGFALLFGPTGLYISALSAIGAVGANELGKRIEQARGR